MNMTCIAGQRRIFLKILFGLVKLEFDDLYMIQWKKVLVLQIIRPGLFTPLTSLRGPNLNQENYHNFNVKIRSLDVKG